MSLMIKAAWTCRPYLTFLKCAEEPMLSGGKIGLGAGGVGVEREIVLHSCLCGAGP